MPEQDVLCELDDVSIKLFPPAKYAYTLHIREGMKKFTMPTRSAQIAAATPSLIKAPSLTRPASITASTTPSKLRQPTKVAASFPPALGITRRISNGEDTRTSATITTTAAATPTKSAPPPPPLNVSPSITIAPTPTALSPAPGTRRRAPTMPRTWSSPTAGAPPPGSAAASAKALTDMLAAKFQDPKYSAKPGDTESKPAEMVVEIRTQPQIAPTPQPPSNSITPVDRASATTTPTPQLTSSVSTDLPEPISKPPPSSIDLDAKGEDAVGPSANDTTEPDINVWDIDDMCVVATPAAAAPPQTLLEKMKDVTVNEELARLAEYALLEIVVITLPETKHVQGILKNETYQKPPEGIRFHERVTEMEHFMYEQEEFEREEEEERKRIERLSRFSSDEDEGDTPQFLAQDKEEHEDEGDEKEEKDEGTDDDSSGKGESALDAWKRAMEEKTQKLQASTFPPSAEHTDDGKRAFRVQPRAWGNAATSIVVDAPSIVVDAADPSESADVEHLKSDIESENENEEVVRKEKPRPNTVKIASKRKVLLDRTKNGNTLGRGFVAPSPTASDDEGEASSESALDAWKRAMEEKTQKMRMASTLSAEGSSHEATTPPDGQRKFRVQPRTWGSNSSNNSSTF